MVHAEIILKGDGRIGLRSILHLYIFLGFNRLVQAVRVASAFHHTTRLLVDNLHLSIHKDVLRVFFKHVVGLEQLIDRMDTLGFDAVVFDHLFLAHQLFGLIQGTTFFQVVQRNTNIWEDKEARVLILGSHGLNASIGQIDHIRLFVDGKQQRLICLRHVALVVLKVEVLRFLKNHADSRFREVLDHGLVLGNTSVGPEER